MVKADIAGLREVAAATRERFRQAADPARVKKYARFFKEGYDAYGLPDGFITAEKDRLLKEYGAEWGLAAILALGDLLVADGKYEEVFLAITLAAARPRDFAPENLTRFAGWLDRGVCNWAHCDTLCGEVLGPMLAAGVAPLAALAGWRAAPSKWRRRAVPVAMLALLKSKPAVKPLVAFVEPMMTDADRVVHQGVGWFLREVWKVEPKPVETFLRKWKDEAPRLIYQYATEKMTPAARERFRAAKKPGAGKPAAAKTAKKPVGKKRVVKKPAVKKPAVRKAVRARAAAKKPTRKRVK
jgi:3-methyladenine DNA glycosylase AlkD